MMHFGKKIIPVPKHASRPVRWIWRRLSDALIGIFALGVILCVGHQGITWAQETKVNAHGFNNLRIEQEDRLSAPIDKSEEVWNFMQEHFVKDKAALKQLDPLFTSYFSEEDFTDTYFDTPAFQALAKQHGIRYRRRANLTNPNDRKSGRELMQIKITDISGNALERGELKFEIEHLTKLKTQEDQHPMLGLVKLAHRENFKQRLSALGLDPYAMKPILTIQDRRTRIYILRDGKPFMSISHDQAWSQLLWAKFAMVEIEPELNEIAFTEADATTRRYMEEIGAKVTAQIKERFRQFSVAIPQERLLWIGGNTSRHRQISASARRVGPS